MVGAVAATRLMPQLVATPGMTELANYFLELDDGAIVLLCAPAGHGKTMILSHFARQATRPVAWVTLSEEAGDPALYRLIGAALVQHGLPFHVDADDSGPDLRGALVNSLLAAPGPVDLVIDGMDALDQPGRDDLVRLIRDWPTRSRLFIAGRAVAGLPVGRLRLAGRIRDFGVRDLRPSPATLASMLEAAGLQASLDDCAAIDDALDGWIAPLRLLLSAPHPPASVAELLTRLDTEPSIFDYVDDLLGSIPEAADLFDLLAVVDEVPPELAIILSGDHEAPARLRTLALGSALVTCPPVRPGGFALHPIARKHRAASLRAFHPERFRELHRAAASWFEKWHDNVRTLMHHLSAGDDCAVGALLRDHAPALLMAGHYGIVRQAVDLLATDGVPDNAMICLAASMAALEIGDLAAADAFIQRAEQVLPDPVAPPLADFRALVLTQRAWLAGEHQDAKGDGAVGARPWRMPGLYAAALSHPGFLTGEDGARDIGAGPHARARDLVFRGMAALSLGDLRRTQALADSAWEIVTNHGWQDTELAAHVTLMHMLVALLRGRPDQCIALGRNGALCMPALDLPLLRPPVQACMGAALFDVGRRAEGFQRMRAVRASLPDDFIVGTMMPLIATLEFQGAMATGLPDEAEEVLAWAENRLGASAEAVVMRATLALHRGRYDAASRMLQPVLEGCLPALLAWTAGDAWLLECERALRAGNERRACLALTRALVTFERCGFTRTLDHASAQVVDLLSRQIGNMDSANGFARDWLAGRRRAMAPPLPHLTGSEWKIVRMLPTHLSLAEIADRLSVSVNTVKSHVKSIYAKLGASSRRTAIATAYNIGLLNAGEAGLEAQAPVEDHVTPSPGRPGMADV